MLVTTYGVGELSALNGMMGAKAERSLVFHVVGMPSPPRILQVSLDTDDTKSRLPRHTNDTLDDQNGGFGDLPDVY